MNEYTTHYDFIEVTYNGETHIVKGIKDTGDLLADYNTALKMVKQDLQPKEDTTSKQRLAHKRFQLALSKLINNDIERFNLSDYMSNWEIERFNCIITTPRDTYNDLDLQLWLNYANGEIVLYMNKYNQDVIDLFNIHYRNKGYKTAVTSNTVFYQ